MWATDERGGLPIILFETETDDSELHPLPNTSPGQGSKEADRHPNPCTDTGFRAPIYVLDNLVMKKQFNGDSSHSYPSKFAANFTIRDSANNYGWRCAWNATDYTDGFWMSPPCAPDDGVADDYSRTRIVFRMEETRILPIADQPGRIQVRQDWYCDPTSTGSDAYS